MTPPDLVGRDGRRYPLAEPRWCGDDGSPLTVSPLRGLNRTDIDTAVRSQWRYAAALPAALAPVSLGEGMTPLLEVRLGGLTVAVKVEAFNPTASFKDRGVSVMVSLLAQQGISAVVEDSSGNAGASLAAYAAAAGMSATILVPDTASAVKTLACRVHGARVEPVAGSREAVAQEALRRATTVFYASHSWHPFFLQGTKLLAYEIWEDLGFRAPDAVLVPAGAGSLVLGCALGFGELVRAGAIARVPRLLAAQPRNCSPLAEAFAADEERVTARAWPPTLAEGTAVASPVRDAEVLAAVRASGGTIVAVEESALAPAMLELAGQGLYVEPTSALVAAALPHLRASGAVAEGERIVAVLSGSGLKATAAIASML